MLVSASATSLPWSNGATMGCVGGAGAGREGRGGEELFDLVGETGPGAGD